MKIFKRGKELLKRIESLEEHLGYIYSIDSDDYASHELIRGNYSDITSLINDVLALKETKKGSK